MAINQLSTSNTFQEWLTATQQIIAVANTITDGYSLNTNSVINLTGSGQTLNVKGTASIANVKSNSINSNTIFISGIPGNDVSLNVSNSIWVGSNVTITRNLTVGNITILGTQLLSCVEFGAVTVTNITMPDTGRFTQTDGSSVIFRIAGNVQQIIANTNFFAGEIISTNSRNSLIATGNVVVTKNLSAGNINTSGNLVVSGNTFLGNGVHVVNFSNFDALRITNRGTGYSFVINDEATDPSPLAINGDGVFIKGDLSPFVTRVGGTTITPEIQQVGSVNANSSFASFSYSADPTISPHYLMARSRGTKSSPTLVSEGDILGRISSAGWDGAKYVESSRIEFRIDTISGAGGVPALNDMPGAISFLITDDGESSPTERLKVNTSHLWANTQNFELRTFDSRFVIGSFENLSTNLLTKRTIYGIDSRFKISGHTLSDSTLSIFSFATNTLTYPGYHMARARGTELAPESVIDGSGLGYISAAGFNADITNYSPMNKFTEAARIQFSVDGTPYANSVPGSISFLTADPKTAVQVAPVSLTEKMKIGANGNVSIGSSLLDYSKLTVYDNSDNPAVYIQNAGSGDSLRVLSSGTGNVISAYDIASDTTPFRVNSDGDTFVGRNLTLGQDLFPPRYVTFGGSEFTTSLNTKVGIVTTSSLVKSASEVQSGSTQSIFNFSASGYPGFFFARARGTLDAPTSVITESILGIISASGYTSETQGYTSKYTEGARIQFEVDQTPGANSVPTSIHFLTSPGGSGSSIPIVVDRMTITSKGNVGIGTAAPTAKLQINHSDPSDAFKVVTSAPFTIDNEGHTFIEANLIVGTTSTNTNISTTKIWTTTINPDFRIVGGSITSAAFISNYSLAGYPSLLFGKGSGTATAAANVADGATLGLISAAGWHSNTNFGGSKLTEAARIQFSVDGTPSANSVPGEIIFLTASGANADQDSVTAPSERMRIRATGNVGINQANPSAKFHIQANETFAALKVVQTGTGNAVEIFDQTNDVTPFSIDATGNVYVGANLTISGLNSALTGNTPRNVLKFVDIDTTVGSSQPLGKIEFITLDANNPSIASYILSSAVGLHGGANLRFAVSSNNVSSPSEVFLMANTRNISYRNFEITADNHDITTGSPNNTIKFVDTDTSVVANQLLGKIEFFTSDTSNPSIASYISSTAVGTSGGANLRFASSSNGGTTREVLQLSNTGLLVINSNVGIGFGPGTGASVTQSDIPVGQNLVRNNPVTINAMSGRIVCANASSTTGGVFWFNVWNSCVSTGDVILASQADYTDDGFTRHRYGFYAVAVHNGRFVLNGERSSSVNNAIPYDTVTVNFVIIKGSSS